jgi:hypothetical protein
LCTKSFILNSKKDCKKIIESYSKLKFNSNFVSVYNIVDLVKKNEIIPNVGKLVHCNDMSLCYLFFILVNIPNEHDFCDEYINFVLYIFNRMLNYNEIIIFNEILKYFMSEFIFYVKNNVLDYLQLIITTLISMYIVGDIDIKI